MTVTPGAEPPEIERDAPSSGASVEDRSVGQAATRRICPFLTIEGGGWRSALPTRDHRCGAVTPHATLTIDKQRRLCLADAHVDCATYLAAIGAPMAGGVPVAPAFAGHPPPGPHPTITRWGLVRTVPVILDRSRPSPTVGAMASDRRGGQLLLGGLLLTAVAAVAIARFSGAGGPVDAGVVTSPNPTPRVTDTPTPTDLATTEPTLAPTPTPPSSQAPTAAPPPTPAPSYRTYTVRSGDTLSKIANQFGTTVRALADLNNIKSADYGRLSVGRVLKIP